MKNSSELTHSQYIKREHIADMLGIDIAYLNEYIKTNPDKVLTDDEGNIHCASVKHIAYHFGFNEPTVRLRSQVRCKCFLELTGEENDK